MNEEYRDEAETAEEQADVQPEVDDPEVPEADALEQAKAVRPPAEERPDEVGLRPEADALEQARGAGYDDEDDERR